MHIARGLYYSSYKTPRVLLWSIGVVIFIVMMAEIMWPNCKYNQINDIFYSINFDFNLFYKNNEFLILDNLILGKMLPFNRARTKALNRIGPHNKVVLDMIYGTLLGDGHAERRIKGNGTRVTFYQEGSHVSYLLWLHNSFYQLGYCNSKVPEIQTRLGSKGKVRKIIRFNTFTFSSFNWIHDLWYVNGVKVIPLDIEKYLSPLALAIWIMDDGGKVNKALKLSTNSYTYLECLLLIKVLFKNFKLKASIQSAGAATGDQYQIYIWKESMPLLREIVLPYVHSSMKYKLIN